LAQIGRLKEPPECICAILSQILLIDVESLDCAVFLVLGHQFFLSCIRVQDDLKN